MHISDRPSSKIGLVRPRLAKKSKSFLEWPLYGYTSGFSVKFLSAEMGKILIRLFTEAFVYTVGLYV